MQAEPTPAPPSVHVVRTDRQGRACWVGAATTAATGWQPAELNGRAVWDFKAPPDVDPHAVQVLRAALEEGRGTAGITLDNLHADGSRHRVRIDLEPEHDVAGRLVGWVAVRHLANGASGVPDGVGLPPAPPDGVGHFIRDLDTGIGHWDEGAWQLFGLACGGPRPDGTAPSVAIAIEAVHPDDRDAVLREVARASRPGNRGRADFRVRAADGGWRHLQSDWVVRAGPDGHRVQHGSVRDITAAVAAARAALQREHQLVMAADLVRIGLVQQDLPGGLLHFNRAVGELFGVAEGQGLDVPAIERCIHPEDNPGVQADVRRSIESPGLVTESAYRVRLPGRPVRHLRTRRTVLPAADGRPARLLAVTLDETERVQIAARERELALGRSQALDLAGLGTWRLIDWDGPIELDERLARICGLPPGRCRLRLSQWSALVHPDDRAMLDAMRDLARRSGTGTAVNRLRIVRRDGQVRWLQAMYRHQPPGSGAVLTGTTQDMTERERTLRRLEALFEQALNGIALLSDDGRLVDVNPAAVRMYGGDRQALLAETLATLVDSTAGPAAVAADWAAFIAAGRTQGLVWLRPRTGPPIAADFVGVANIEPGLHMMMLSDATQRLHAERQLRELAARQQDDFDALSAELARDVHDQLGQTLGALMFEIGMHGRRTGTDVGPLKALLDDAVATTRGLTRALHPASLDLGLLAALRELAEDVSRRTDIDVRLRAPPALPDLPEPVVRAIYRIAQEALNNVVKHAFAETADVQVDVARPAKGSPAGELTVRIVDSGRGFLPERRPSVRPQAGLGLVGMRERARQIGAHFEILSRPGSGCRIILRLALDAAAGEPAARAHSVSPP